LDHGSKHSTFKIHTTKSKFVLIRHYVLRLPPDAATQTFLATADRPRYASCAITITVTSIKARTKQEPVRLIIKHIAARSVIGFGTIPFEYSAT
jgi:hypothetical protein